MDADTSSIQAFENQNNNYSNNNHEVSRHDIRSSIAKSVELRALHAALVQNSPASLKFASSTPASRPLSQFSAHDYPIFTPTYDDETVQVYPRIPMKSLTISESWDEHGCLGGNDNETVVQKYMKDISASRKGLTTSLSTSESHICPLEDHKSVTALSINNVNVLHTSPGTEFYNSSRRNSLGDFKSVSSCNRCKPTLIATESEFVRRNSKNSNVVVPLTDSHSSVLSQTKNRGVISWLFPKLRKKYKSESSPNRTESEEVSQVLSKDLGILSIEALKRELIKANECKETALFEVSEMKSSLSELKQKLEYLENYCEELKKALKQASQARESQKLTNVPRRGKSIDGNGENSMPVSEEVMGEGFLQIVSEARLSVKQFCKILLSQIDETDGTLIDNLNSFLQPYKLSLNSNYSKKAVLYHFEAVINQELYQDFENCVFQKKGSPKHLDPQQDRQAQFSSFVALRDLSWNEVLRKGTKYYSEEFSKFCDQRMNFIITTMNWTRPWPEQLLQAFFVSAKCIWLLHLLAFSFNPPLGILRVEENRSFDPDFMEDMFMDKQRSYGPSRVKIMVMPGFYVHDRVLRCKVLCRYKSEA
ncbi:DNA double-strand break repair rad50 ATPase [Tripterygium wilfordii]|uniref:DNA double-strand break repair rad50 ATPase n=1 Tax=Tripterygium wilfordii TaxID=458696 RepID=A0A7J7DRM8_TRIWF|nr:IRK-interacting protein [Tripterygium wilfordii]KAF5748776.1 DNA double-strand break repair rad50 ATPase [Tripterygium wilfordii]